MITVKNLEQIIASRTLNLNEHSNSKVEIKIGMPQALPENRGFYCPFQITGLAEEILDWCGGIDTAQALLLALERVGAILKDSEEYRAGQLFWVGSEVGRLGFPAQDSCGMLDYLESN